MEERKVLAFGINPSEREPGAKHYDGKTEPDPTVRKVFSHVFGENCSFNDIFEERESDSTKMLEKDEISALFLKNKERLRKLIIEKNPDLIVWMFSDKNLHELLSEFSLEFEKFPEQLTIFHPAAARPRGWIGTRWMEYVDHIKGKIAMKEVEKEFSKEDPDYEDNLKRLSEVSRLPVGEIDARVKKIIEGVDGFMGKNQALKIASAEYGYKVKEASKTTVYSGNKSLAHPFASVKTPINP